MLRSIDEDDSGGESETKEGVVLDGKLCSSGKMSDMKKLSNLMIHDALLI